MSRVAPSRVCLVVPSIAALLLAATTAPVVLAMDDAPKSAPAPAPAPATAPATAPAPGEGEPSLGGPKVAPGADRPTIVERDVTGKVKVLEISPPEAALTRLKLDDATREKVDRILAERAKLLDVLVRDNLLLLVELDGARQAGDQDRVREGLRTLTEASEPLRRRGRLLTELQAALPKEQGEQLRTMIGEYMQARIADEQAAASAEGASFDGRRFLTEETLRTVGNEVRRSYERVVGQAAADFDALLQELALSPEKEAEVRSAVMDLNSRYAGKVPSAEYARVYLKVYSQATPEQRQVLLRRAGMRNAAPADPGAPAPSRNR
ncbi:MAG: hypothetical protein ACK5XO_10220 [Phycisphaerales bacterium]